MPYAGGLLDQPALAMQKFELILYVYNEIEENEQRRIEAQNDRGARATSNR
jgi:hypothetical protein